MNDERRWLRACLFLLLSSAPAHASTVERAGDEKLHAQMDRLLAERGPVKGWVFFTDKALSTTDARREALERARLALHPRALERRRRHRTAPGDVDVRDVAVHAPYVAAVLATGATLSIESAWLNAISAHGTREQFRAIAELPFVDRIEPVRRGTLLDERALEPHSCGHAPLVPEPDATSYGLSFAQLDELNLIPLHQRGFTGKGVVMGILDTGFHRGHQAFNRPGHEIEVIAEYDFVDDDPFTGVEPGDPPTQHHHGTKGLGAIAAYLPDILLGGAFDASFVLAKTEDTTDEYTQEEDFYVAGLAFIEANGADMATSSLGYSDWYSQSQLGGTTAVTTLAVNVATSNGLICVTAAGNDGNDLDPTTSRLNAPADAFEVITCGGVRVSGVIADFSSDGPTADGRVKPELLARGELVYTVCPDMNENCTTDLRGTSGSTSLIAAMIACILQARPEWGPRTLRQRLFATGADFLATGTFDPFFVRGYGVPDAALATLGGPIAGTRALPPPTARSF